MKLPFRAIEAFVKTPDPQARAILVYGPDAGLVKERAASMGRSVVADLNDPFNVAVLNAQILKDDPARLSDEAQAMSMMGGARLIRIEEGSDALTPLLRDYLAQPSTANLVIIEAGELGPRSTLRALFEKLPNAAAVPCYVEDERDITRVIRDTVQQAGLRIDGDAVAYLAQTIAGDRARVRSEIEKLLVYKGSEPGAITLENAQAACGQGFSSSLDDLVYSVGGRQPEGALKALQMLQEEGVGFAPILRALQAHFRRLHLAGQRVAAGEDSEQVMKTLTPPIFFKLQPGFARQTRLWSDRALLNVLGRLAALEAQCKQTGFPADTLCAQAILGMSYQR